MVVLWCLALVEILTLCSTERPPFETLHQRLRALEEAAVLSSQPNAELEEQETDEDGYVEFATSE